MNALALIIGSLFIVIFTLRTVSKEIVLDEDASSSEKDTAFTQWAANQTPQRLQFIQFSVVGGLTTAVIGVVLLCMP